MKIHSTKTLKSLFYVFVVLFTTAIIFTATACATTSGNSSDGTNIAEAKKLITGTWFFDCGYNPEVRTDDQITFNKDGTFQSHHFDSEWKEWDEGNYSIENDENQFNFDFKGMAIMHTAVSDAGIAPTTSNKTEIESSIAPLSKAGVKFHIGKGSLSDETKIYLDKYNSVFIITPPVAALLTNSVKSKKCVAYENEGMEAFYELEVENIPGIVAIAHGESIF